jgi:hypothetical protein
MLLANRLAELVVVIHFLFVLFVVFGALLLFWSKKFVLLHPPAVIWGALIEFTGWICPLTPLENKLRYHAGRAIYEGGFVENYVIPVLYPDGLTRQIQIALGILVVVFNLFLYWVVFRRRKPSTPWRR